MQRTKGMVGEREVAAMFKKDLGVDAKRNLQQTQNGGYDLAGIPFFAVEVKRHEKLSIGTWWTQAIKQAVALERMPLLMYRRNREQWWCVMDLKSLTGVLPPEAMMRVTCRKFDNLVMFSWLSFLKVYRHYVSETVVCEDEC